MKRVKRGVNYEAISRIVITYIEVCFLERSETMNDGKGLNGYLKESCFEKEIVVI